MPTRFDLDDLLRVVGDPATASIGQASLVKTLMAIDYLPTVAEKVGQLDERIEALHAVELEVHARIVNHPELRGRPLPSVPPRAVAGEFQVLMALQTARRKLGDTRAALARRLG